MIIAFDIGNTRTKMAAFEQGKLIQHWNLSSHHLAQELSDILSQLPQGDFYQIGWMSVANVRPLDTYQLWKSWENSYTISHIHTKTNLPIAHAYQTPETLGIDRIVAVIAAKAVFPDASVLVIDAGTALTYEFATAEGVYLGGGISPGIQMRFKALHTFTARLPLIEEIAMSELVGTSTIACMRSGVLNGIVAEMEGICTRYQQRYGEDVKICLTGGDMHFFENQLKNLTFADENLTLKGICHIIMHNSTI